MIQTLELIENLQSGGVHISANGETLKIDAPKGLLTPELKELLRQHKAEIIQQLTHRHQLELQAVFNGRSPSGQFVIKSIAEELKRLAARGIKLLLDMPTVAAYDAELALLAGAERHAGGGMSEADLKALIRNYVDTHVLGEKVSMQWTGKAIPLYYLTVFLEGRRIESYNCSQVQAWIIREYWSAINRKATIGVISI